MYIKALLAPPEGHPSIKSSSSCTVLLPVNPPFSSTRSLLPRRSVAQFALENSNSTSSNPTEDDEEEKESNARHKAERRADFVLAAGLDISDDEGETEGDGNGNDGADNSHGGNGKASHKRVASQQRVSGRQRRQRKLD